MRGAAAWERLAAGALGQVPTSQGPAASLAYQDIGTVPTHQGLYGSANFFAFIANATNGTFNQLNMGAGNPSSSLGTNIAVFNAGEGTYQQSTTGAIAGNNAGFLATSVPFLDWSYPFDIVFIVRTGADITSVRFWIGMAGSAATNSDTHGGAGTPARFVGFRYSSATDGGWVGVNNDGTNQSNTATVAAIAASTRYKLRIRSTGAAAFFSVDGGAEVTLGTTFPGGATRVGMEFLIYTTTNAARVFQTQRIFGQWGL
jgi:hypothetical protein